MVLLVDTFERCQGLERWLCEEFLPRSPAGQRGGDRRTPGAGCALDVATRGGRDLLRVMSLRNLPPDDAARLLHARGLPAGAHQAVLSFTGGNPLALSLAAAVAVREEGVEVRLVARART